MPPLGSGKLGGDIGVDGNLMAVDRQEPVPPLQPIFPGIGKPLCKVSDHRHGIAAGHPKENGHQHKARHKVHHRPGGQDDELPPGGLSGEGPGILTVLVLPFHGAVSPDGEGPKGVQGFPLLPGENGRSHANGELIDLNVQAFGRQEMPALMDCNE